MNDKIENVSVMDTNETISAEMPEDDRLIGYLKGLEKQQNRAALANLRRGLGKPPKTVMEMYPYLGQFLSHEPKPRYETAIFIVAALFAYYPDAPGNAGNLGDSIRRMKDDSDSIEKRFVALLNAEAEDLPYYLRQIIGLLKSKEIAVNWNLLFRDVKNWDGDKRYVQNAWARSFWGTFQAIKNRKTQEEQNNDFRTTFDTKLCAVKLKSQRHRRTEGLHFRRFAPRSDFESMFQKSDARIF